MELLIKPSIYLGSEYPFKSRFELKVCGSLVVSQSKETPI